MWRVIKRWVAAWRRDEPRPTVLSVSVDPSKCLAHEWCVHLCPGVFEFRDGSAQVKVDAAAYFVSHGAQIVRAGRECPTEAIRVQVKELPNDH